jgi:xylulokinase
MRILAIDLGTGALKALVFDAELRLHGRASLPIQTRRSLPGQAEQDVPDWLSAMARAVPAALTDAGHPGIDAIVVTGHMSAPCFIGPDGQALGPVQTLSDTQCAGYVRDDPLALALTGNRSATHFGRAKIVRALAEVPALAQPGTKILAPKDVLRLALGGTASTDASDAANLLLIDPATGGWSPDLLAEAGIAAALMPPLLAASARDGSLNAKWAALFGLDAGIPLITGGADMATAARAGRIDTKGRLLVTIGTSATSLIACPGPRPGLVDRLTFHADGAGNGFALGSHFNGGACLDWFHALSDGAATDRDATLNALSAVATTRPLADTDPLFLSSLLGAGSPRFDAAERGAFFGLAASHDRADLFRAILEGISFELAATVQVLAADGFAMDHILAGGGGMRLGIWPQMLADVTGLEVRLAASADASAEGAAMLALEALGAEIPQEAIREEIFRVDPERHMHHQFRHKRLSQLRVAIGACLSGRA